MVVLLGTNTPPLDRGWMIMTEATSSAGEKTSAAVPVRRTAWIYAAAVFAVGAVISFWAGQKFGGGTEAFDQRIHDYLLNHPETTIEALKRADAMVSGQREARSRAALAGRQTDLFSDHAAPIIGAPEARLTIVEFFDYRCPYCKQVQPTLESLIRENRDVRVILKEYPILGKESAFAARAALAAVKQGKYEGFHDALLRSKGPLNDGAVLQLAGDLGIDTARLAVDAGVEDIQKAIEDNAALARELGIHGTPVFVIGNEVVSGALDIEDLKGKVAKLKPFRPPGWRLGEIRRLERQQA
jgi:protein-disulfide isomerase